MPSAFLLAAPQSGSGKTTISLALMAALRARGKVVQAFKVGPDYIDPSYHARITGRPSHNLDTWMLSTEENRRIFASAMRTADVGVVEGVMGLFDGVDGRRPDGSSAHLAKLLDLPVLLIVDARSMARSAAALVAGFSRFDKGVRVAGVVWNRVGSPSHRRILEESLDGSGLPPSLGAVGREARVALPERHLGLVTPEDAELPLDLVASLARLAEQHVDVDRLLALSRLPSTLPDFPDPRSARLAGRRIAVPRDAAFCFYYEENLRILQDHGASIVPFSPVAGDGVPPEVDGAYLGGGYPEVHAERLAANRGFLDGLRALHAQGAPVYAECGGFMTLCQSVEDLQGRQHAMAGVFPARARMNGRGFRLGYREVELRGHGPLQGLRARGHEFHYSRVEVMPEGVERAYRVWNARGEELEPEGYRLGNTLAGYIHLHFGSNPELPLRFFGASAPASPPE